MSSMTEDPKAYWNHEAGPRWVRVQDGLDHLLAPITAHLLSSAAVQPGERVLDVGCGTGTTVLSFAEAVGASGSVMGVDISAPMLAYAKERARSRANVTLHLGDAAKVDFAKTPPYDLVTSRFGVMFFQDPPAAFANLRRALRPGGRVVFVCWQPYVRNPWISYLFEAFPEFEAPLPAPEDGPGPFSLSDRVGLETLVKGAGFQDVRIEGFETPLVIGPSPDEVLQTMSEVGPFARVLTQAEESSGPSARDALWARARAFLEERFRAGPPEVASAVWTVSMRGS